MNLKKGLIAFFFPIFLLALSLNAAAQFGGQISKTFGDKNSATGNELIEQFLRMKEGKAARTNPENQSVAKFSPQGNSGVAESLSDALGQNAEQKAALTEAFRQIKQAYEAEAASEGKSNNLAAAFAFFIAANVMTYTQGEAPSDQITEELFNDLQAAISNVPAFAAMNDAEKQKMHDWLIYMGGFAMANYMDARQSGDGQALANIKDFADYSLRLVLGVEGSKLNFSAGVLTVQDGVSSPAAGAPAAEGGGGQITGTWSRKAAVANSNMITNAGYYVSRFVFSKDGTYSFKSEMWGGYLRSEEWWTTEETGTFAVAGDSLTVSPQKSVATLRNRAGAVLKTQNNPPEKVVFRWQTVYYEGLRETHLVLRPAREVGRYGGFSGDSRFPNAYVFDQTSVIEWKF